ncbi:MAG: osmoprotectant transport system substrate-binding protein [Actinomycetota bacterium]|nr:osmoprotectant transport system substrate-binding protein [Actinomycetota bacterium]
MRTSPRALSALVLAACLAFALAACGSSGSSGSSGTTTPSGTSASVASKLVLGGPPECPKRPFCEIGLKQTYGLTFKSFKALDPGGPLTVNALAQNKIQVGVLFTTSGVIASKGWVLLEDDKNLQPADNVTPVLRNEIVDKYGTKMTDLVNAVSAKITTQVLTDLNKQTDIDQKDPDDVAMAWLQSNNLVPASKVAAVSGPTIVVGSANFGEDVTLADIYADMLKANGYPVSKKLSIGARDIYFAALKKNQISFLPEYAGSLLTFIDAKKPATTNTDKNATQLAGVLKPLKLTALDSAPAQDVNGYVVTKETADKYNLAKISDLAKPAP